MIKIISFSSTILRLKNLFLCSGLFFTPLSLAKIHIEPYAGWSLTYTNSRPLNKKTLDNRSEAFDYIKGGRYYSGPTVGMRLGYSSLGLATGLDFMVGHWMSIYAENFTASKNKETISPILPGFFLSYKLPLFFRVYASLIPYAPVRFTSQRDEKAILCTKSKGVKLGLSYFSLPFLSVNFEYLPMYMHGTHCSTWSHTGTVYANFTF